MRFGQELTKCKITINERAVWLYSLFCRRELAITMSINLRDVILGTGFEFSRGDVVTIKYKCSSHNHVYLGDELLLSSKFISYVRHLIRLLLHVMTISCSLNSFLMPLFVISNSVKVSIRHTSSLHCFARGDGRYEGRWSSSICDTWQH